MKRLQGHQKLSEIPRPCEWFDIIAGTGTGGIIAILLGRLGLCIGEAIEAYQEILREAYSEKKLFGDDTTFKATNLENAISRVVARYTSNANESMADPKTDTGGCKTFVCAMLAGNMRAGEPVLIRSYKVLENDGPSCSITQAARATSAMAGLFKPVTIDELGIKVAYVDGGLGNNNPTAHMLTEAGRLFPNGNVSFVLSIGAGHLQPVSLSSSKDAKKLGLCIATDSERIAQEMARRFQDTTDLYFRFNVDQGLQHIGATSWEKLAEVVAHSRQHTQMFEVNTLMARAVKAFAAGAVFVPATQLNGIIPPTELVKALRSCPPPSAAFTGQEDVLAQIHDCIFDGSEARHVFVLHGLGGAGKTQSALKFVQMHREKFLDVFYLDATSTHTIEADLKSIAVAKKTGKSPGDALHWLANHQKWLIVYNNADDTSLNLQGYIPPCFHGDILITTRNRQLISLAQGTNAHRQLSTMQLEDGKRLLLKISRVAEDNQTDKLSETIVHELGGLALAIVQAGAYICVHECGLAAYLDMYRAYRGDILEEYKNLSQKLDDYQWTVYTTWRVSLGKLSSRAVELFYLLSFMHHERISEETFRRAYLRIATREPSTNSTSEHSSPKDSVIIFLSSFGAPDLTWYRPAFLSLMTEIRSYSLIDFDPLSNTYSIHPLVQSWARTTAGQPHEAEKRTVSVLALSIDKEFGSQDYEYRAKLIPHLDSLAQKYDTDPKFARKFAMVYQEAGRYQSAKALQAAAVDFNKRTLGVDHPSTLTDMFDLASFCSDNGDLQQAEELYTVVVEARTRVLGDSHTDTYRTLAYLALNYHAQGRFHEAEPIQVQVLEAAKYLLGPENRETLQCQHALAATYQGMGQIHKAESLLRELVEVEKKTLGPNHPVTLTSMHNLASTFEKLGKFDEAEILIIQTWEIWRHLSGPTHPDVLSCMTILGGIRHEQGRSKEALEMQTELDGLYKRTLGEAHPATLANSGNLACTYQALGRTTEAESMYQQVLDTKIRVLGKEHVDVLSTINNLSSLYATMPGREAEAESMMVNEISDRSRRPFNNDIGGTAGLMINLAALYIQQKRWEEAETLTKKALVMQLPVFGAEHRRPVTARKMLENIQHNMRRERYRSLAYLLVGVFISLLSMIAMYFLPAYR